MPAIQNIDRLRRKLDSLANRYQSSGTPAVVVGYAANYAVYVHERQAKHAPGKQWKFLEQPARQLGSVLGDMIKKSLSVGTKMLQSLYLAGLRLQRESQQLVPVDTGNLRGSAFTAREDELESVIAASEGQLMGRMQKQFEQHTVQAGKNKAKQAKRKRGKERSLLKKAINRSWKKAKKRR